MKTVAILGAAGRIGEAATKAFLAAGWRVRGIARGAKVSTLADGVEPVTADAFDRQSLIDACNGADVILHALNPSYDKWAETVMPLAENVLAAAEASGATVMIPGNVYNFGTHIGIDTSETDPMRPDVEKGKIRVDMESLFERAARTRGVRTVIVRAGDFFGGERPESWLDLMILRDLKNDKFAWPGSWDAVHAFAYLPDLAKAFVKVAEKRARVSCVRAVAFPWLCDHWQRNARGGAAGSWPQVKARWRPVDRLAPDRAVQPGFARSGEDAVSVARTALARQHETRSTYRCRTAPATRDSDPGSRRGSVTRRQGG
jgi:nucleoside-diphosphate-sugar epimerase